MDNSNSHFLIKIIRNQSCSDESTIGRMLVQGKEIGRTLELPWRNNEENVSRVPAGIYDANIRSDGPLKWRVELKDVPSRGNIQIHVGNYAREIKGCILVGSEVVDNGKECMAVNSRQTLLDLAAEMSRYSNSLSTDKSVPIDIRVEIED